ncbi:MAG: YwaF family protein [Tenericutes bacterium]|nr:YwaF family protein [Mycoplasmatota bacterium]
MIYLIILALSSSLIWITWMLNKKKNILINKILKVLSILLFTIYMGRLFSEDSIRLTFNLFLTDIETPINAYDTWLSGAFMSIFMVFLKWASISSIVFLILSPFFKLKNVTIIASVFAFSIALFNLIFFKENVLMFSGEVNLLSYRSIQFLIEIALVIAISTINIYNYYKKNPLLKAKEILKALAVFLIASIALMPQATLYNLFGNYGEIPEEFNFTHILIIVVTILFTVISYLVMRKKDQIQKDFFITFIVFAAFFQYFSYRQHGLSGLPLHLCNTAIILMMFSIVFRLKGFFYFNYFANVLGAMMAILLPDISSDLFSEGAVRYLFNHWFVFAWPILAVALNTFKKPTLKDMNKAIVVFSAYFIAILFVNAWLNNYQSVDYFFVYRNHITDMLGATGIQYNNVLSFEWKGLTFIFYWLYQLLFYLGFIFLMFMSWYVYDGVFGFASNQRKLKAKQKQIRLDECNLHELLEGRNPSEPINLGGIDMIKISHFSKKYGNSERYAVKDFSLEVHKGEVFGFLGHNGAGKSTTIKSLVGIQSITEGEMEICGYSIKTQGLEAKLQIGYVSDNHALYEKLTGREYIQYVEDLYKVDPEVREERLAKLLDKFNLAYAIDQEIKSYSHGMKQKLVVIAALIHEPPVWILDEPLTGLDPTSAYQIKESMREHAKKGNIVFFSSHVIEVVEKICDKIAIITNGTLQGVYDMNDIRKNKISLEELYMSKINKDRASHKDA